MILNLEAIAAREGAGYRGVLNAVSGNERWIVMRSTTTYAYADQAERAVIEEWTAKRA